jgi:hypothetical protein
MAKGWTLKETVLDRFWRHVLMAGPSQCWNWNSCTHHGHGTFSIKGKEVYAHRFSYEIAKGLIPEDLKIDHLCRNPLCVNPSHLEVVTNKENILRGIGWSAINARKTHCPRGHKYTTENIYPTLKHRVCRKCRTLRMSYLKERKWWRDKNAVRLG